MKTMQATSHYLHAISKAKTPNVVSSFATSTEHANNSLYFSPFVLIKLQVTLPSKNSAHGHASKARNGQRLTVRHRMKWFLGRNWVMFSEQKA